VIKTLSEQARSICEPSELEKELKHLERAFGWNGYSRQQFNRATRQRNIELRRQQTGDVEEKVTLEKAYHTYTRSRIGLV